VTLAWPFKIADPSSISCGGGLRFFLFPASWCTTSVIKLAKCCRCSGRVTVLINLSVLCGVRRIWGGGRGRPLVAMGRGRKEAGSRSEGKRIIMVSSAEKRRPRASSSRPRDLLSLLRKLRVPRVIPSPFSWRGPMLLEWPVFLPRSRAGALFFRGADDASLRKPEIGRCARGRQKK
jgi:hypothetical protein